MSVMFDLKSKYKIKEDNVEKDEGGYLLLGSISGDINFVKKSCLYTG